MYDNEKVLNALNRVFVEYSWESSYPFFYRGSGEFVIYAACESLYIDSKLLYRAYAMIGLAELESFSSCVESPCDALLGAVRSLLGNVNKLKISEV